MSAFDLSSPAGRVTVVGGGRAGLAAARYLRERDCEVVIADDAASDAVSARLADAGLEDVEVRGGGLDEETLCSGPAIVLSPGVPRAHPAVAAALARGVEVFNEVELGAAALERPTVLAITGTNGKSTTATIAGSIARAYREDAFVGGNLGRPLCEAIVEGERPSLLVIELSSYQLETIRQLPVRAAVVTNLSPDHLDRYPTVDAYYAAKARLFELVTPGGGCSINATDPVSAEHLDARTTGARLDFDVAVGAEGVALEGTVALVNVAGDERHVDLDHPLLLGRHNLQNAMAAIAGAALCGVPPEAWKDGIRSYQGIAHRMERVAEKDGVVWINDTKATNVDAAVKAVRSFERGVHLIVGGVGKGASYAPLAEAARDRVRAVYCIGDEGPAIGRALADAVGDVFEDGVLEAAMERAASAAVSGDVVLLAPACASFDQFANFVARGDTFRQIAKRLTGEAGA